MDEFEFAISTVRSPNGVYDALYTDFFPTDPKRVVLAKHKALEFHAIDPSDASLRCAATFSVSAPIKCLSELKIPGLELHWLIVLSEDNTVSFLSYDAEEDRIKVVEHFAFDTRGHQINTETRSMMVASWDKNDSGRSTGPKNENFLIIHTFHGYILSLNLNTFINQYLSRHGKRKIAQELPVTHSLGNVILQDMTALGPSSLAVLYRDFDFNFSMRFYTLAKSPMQIVKQHEVFSEPPHILIAPNIGGVFVMSDLQIYYFTSNEPKSVQFDVDEDSSDMDLLKHKDCVVKKLYGTHHAEFIGETWSQHTVIDDNRVLVVSDTGLTCLLYFNIDYKATSSRKIIVKSINLLRLGKSTIPSSLIHIDEDIFFASSTLSRPILFRVKPSKPFIEVLHFLPSTPPILHLEQQINKFDEDNILVCQGAHYGSEVIKVPTANVSLEQLQSHKVSSESRNLVANSQISILATSSDHSVLNKISIPENKCTSGNRQTVLDAWHVKESQVALSRNGITHGNEVSTAHDIVRGQITTDTFCFAELPNKVTHGLLSNLKSTSCLTYTDDFDQLSKLVATKSYVLLSFWSGQYEVFQTDGFHSVCKGQVPGDHGIVSASLCDDNNTIKICLSTTLPSIIVHEYDKLTKKIEYRWTKDFEPNTLSYHFVECSSSTPRTPLLVFRDKEIAQVNFERGLYTFSLVFRSPSAIRDAKLIGRSSRELAVLQQDSTVVIYGIVIGHSEHALISPHLNSKSLHVPNTSYMVILSRQTEPSSDNYDMSITSCVQLIDSDTMKVIDVFKVKDDTLFDLALINDDNLSVTPRFLVLHSGKDMLYMFQIENSKLKKLTVILSQEMIDRDAVFNNISNNIVGADSDEGELYLSGSLNCSASLKYISDDTARLRIFLSQRRYALSYAIGSVRRRGHLVVCDTMKGFYILDVDDGGYPKLISTQNSFYKNSFITAFDAFIDSSKTLRIVYGDIYGNLVIFKAKNTEAEECMDEDEPLTNYVGRYTDDGDYKFINIGEPINSIKVTWNDFSSNSDSKDSNLVEPFAVIGTAVGGIYSLGAIHDTLLFDKLTSVTSKLTSSSLSGFKHTWSSPWMSSNTQVSHEQTILDFAMLEQLLAIQSGAYTTLEKGADDKDLHSLTFEAHDIDTKLVRDVLQQSHSVHAQPE